jgi:hypothetical protein
MYLTSNYSAELYAGLERLKDRILELDPKCGEFNALTCRNFLVNELGIKRVREGIRNEVSLNGKNWLGSDVSRAMKQVIRETKRYLEKHKTQFEQDVKDRKLEGHVLGEQGEFTFSGRLGKYDLSHVRATREDMLGHFKSQRR